MAMPSTEQIKDELELFDIAYGDDSVLEKSKYNVACFSFSYNDWTKC